MAPQGILASLAWPAAACAAAILALRLAQR
jgi:hypothetical protein